MGLILNVRWVCRVVRSQFASLPQSSFSYLVIYHLPTQYDFAWNTFQCEAVTSNKNFMGLCSSSVSQVVFKFRLFCVDVPERVLSEVTAWSLVFIQKYLLQICLSGAYFILSKLAWLLKASCYALGKKGFLNIKNSVKAVLQPIYN